MTTGAVIFVALWSFIAASTHFHWHGANAECAVCSLQQISSTDAIGQAEFEPIQLATSAPVQPFPRELAQASTDSDITRAPPRAA